MIRPPGWPWPTLALCSEAGREAMEQIEEDLFRRHHRDQDEVASAETSSTGECSPLLITTIHKTILTDPQNGAEGISLC